MADVMSCGVHLRTNVSIDQGIVVVERGGPHGATASIRIFRNGPIVEVYLTTAQAEMLIAGLKESIGDERTRKGVAT